MAERELPNNSDKAADTIPGAVAPPFAPAPKAEREKKVEAVEGLGEVVVQKPGLGKRFKNTFFGGDAKETARTVWQGLLVPGLKNVFLDVIQQGSERMVLGETRSISRNSTLPNLLGLGHQAYNRMYQNGPMPGGGVLGASPLQQLQQQANRQARATHDFSNFVVTNRAAAEVVVDRMYDLLSRDGVVTVADFLDLLGEGADYTMQKWGWLDLRGTQIVRVPQGYLFDLPKPIPLD